jgi:L-threonylcarbamoyladenylate synthase
MQNITKKAITLLKQGELIGLPTETVYGLAGDAKNEIAIKKIFNAKGRPSDHPLIVHIGTFAEIDEWAQDISSAAKTLMQTFWPGPLTLILKKQPQVSMLLTGGQESIGLRMPNHPMALEVLRAFGSALAAPSANQFGHISPTRPEDVIEELDDHVALVLPGGQTDIGIESIIVDARTSPFTILRQGAITQEMLEQALKQKVLMKADTQLRVSGNLPSHYAPYTPLIVLEKSALEKFTSTVKQKTIALTYSKIILPKSIKVIKMPQTETAYAHELYAQLRNADHQKAELIIVETPPTGGLWDAIHDRLQRAAHR